MLEKKSFKENIKIEIEKLKKMTFKDKLWYIKEYYGIQIFVTILFLTICFSLLFNIFKKDSAFNVMFLNKPLKQTSYENIYNGFFDYANFKEKKEDWELNPNVNIIIKNDEPLNGVEYLAKINAMIAGQLLDVLITDEYFVDYFLNQSLLLNLEQTLPKDLLDNLATNFVYKKGKDNKEKVYAIDIKDAPIIKENISIKGSVYFVILANSKHIDRSVQFLKYLYNL